MPSISIVSSEWAQRGLPVSTLAIGRALYVWDELQRKGELPTEWAELPGEPEHEGVFKMISAIGAPSGKCRHLCKLAEDAPHGAENSAWGTNPTGVRSNTPEYKAAAAAWRRHAEGPAHQAFKWAFPVVTRLLATLGIPPRVDPTREHLVVERVEPSKPWTRENARWAVRVGPPNKPKAKKPLVGVLHRQRAYMAWRRCPTGMWPTFKDFLKDVGYPPDDGKRWGLVTKDWTKGDFSPGNVLWVCRGAGKGAGASNAPTPSAPPPGAPTSTSSAPDSSSEPGQAPPQAHQGAGAAASPCSLPLVQDNATLAAALSFLSNACGTTDDSVRTATRYILDREEGKGLDPVFLPVLTTYRTAIRAARGIA